MGSKFSRAVQPHVKATASPFAGNQQESANGGEKRQEPLPRLPDIFAYDDLNITASTTTASGELVQSCHSQRRDSAPASTWVTATDKNTAQLQDSMDEFNLFVAARRLMSIQYAGTDPTPTLAPVVTMPLPTPPTPPPAAQSPTTETQCLICCKSLPNENEVIKPCRSCYNAYCATCLKNMFIEACKDMSRMPPRCCVQIQLHHVKPHLTWEETVKFKSKYEEWLTPRPFYCPVSNCSTFIPERLQPDQTTGKGKSKRADSGTGTPTPRTFSCPACKAGICTDCRQTAHPDIPCKIVDEFGVDPEIAELLKSWGYKKCPKCGHGVKRMYGCSHMECRCGAHFCWGCLGNREDCYDGCGDGEDDYEDEYDDEAPGEAEDLYVVDGAEDGTPAAGDDSAPTSTMQRNLDGGGAGYWANTGLDFGDEPTDDIHDRSWHCEHNFENYKIPLAEALRHDSAHKNMECVKCWSPIHPEIEAPTPKIANHRSEKVVPAGAGGISRGIVRGRGRGHVVSHRRYVPPRGLFRANTTIGTAPHLTVIVSSPLSQSAPAQEPSPMEDVQYTHHVVDTYGNIIATTEVETPQRAFLDDTLLQSKHAYRGEDQDTIKDAVLSFSTRSDVFQDANSKFSFAHECQYCELLVCTACKDRTIAIQQEKEREEMEREQERKKEMEAVLAKEAVDKEKVLAEQADTETQDMSPAIHD